MSVAGHMDDPNMVASAGMGQTTVNIVVFSVMVGLNGAIETLASQAYGNGQKELCGVYLNRGRMVQLAFGLPLCFLPFFYGEQMLLAIGQDADVAYLAGQYMKTALPAIIFVSHLDLMRRW